ncbi:MAG: hypothetical protein V4719_00895 [Planctomycetota bacterium]
MSSEAIEKWKKIGTGLWLSVGGAAVSYLATIGPSIDQTTLQGLITAVLISNVVNIGRKFLLPA